MDSETAAISENLLLLLEIFSRCAKMSREKAREFRRAIATDGRTGVERRRLEAYRLLGIPAGSDRETVAHAYRRLARTIHPDVSRDPKTADRFAILTEAYRLVTEEPPTPVAPATPGNSHRPAQASGGNQRGEEWLAPAWATIRAVSQPSAGDVSGHCPPIVAGPVLIRPLGAAPGRGARDG